MITMDFAGQAVLPTSTSPPPTSGLGGLTASLWVTTKVQPSTCIPPPLPLPIFFTFFLFHSSLFLPFESKLEAKLRPVKGLRALKWANFNWNRFTLYWDFSFFRKRKCWFSIRKYDSEKGNRHPPPLYIITFFLSLPSLMSSDTCGMIWTNRQCLTVPRSPCQRTASTKVVGNIVQCIICTVTMCISFS